MYLGAISKYKPPGPYIRRGDLTEGFLHYDFGGLIFGGAYTWRGLFSEFYGMYVIHQCGLIRLIAPLKKLLMNVKTHISVERPRLPVAQSQSNIYNFCLSISSSQELLSHEFSIKRFFL